MTVRTLFIAQSSFSGDTAIELSENNFETLFAGANNEQAVNNFNFCTEDLLTDLFTDKEDSGRWITITVTHTRKFRRGMKQACHKTQRGQLRGVHEFGVTTCRLKNGTPYQ